MSLSLVNSETIRRHPANTSPSKIVNQFSKSKRFLEPNPECPMAFYTYDSHLSKRKTSFGYGNKSDFTRTLTVSPPATKYDIKSFVQEQKLKGKGQSFGLDREKLPDNSYLIPQLHKNPGPGKYENQKDRHMNLSFTCRPRTLDVIEKNKSFRQSPGPGAYKEIDCVPKNGRFSVSKYSDAKFSTLNSQSPRFTSVKDSPGPLSYKEGDSLAGHAKYLLSQRKSNGTRVFAKTARFGDGFWKSTTNPGPGHYSQFSDFGLYGDAKYYKTLSSLK